MGLVAQHDRVLVMAEFSEHDILYRVIFLTSHISGGWDTSCMSPM